MGMLGDILYPHNQEMAEELNKKYQILLDNNTLQNNLVNSYHALASDISKFDGYLMSILCMHYQVVYDEEKLANLPPTDIPKLSQSIADRIEAYTLTGVGAVQALKGLNAMRKGVVNVYRNAGVYRDTIKNGFESFKGSMQNGIDSVRYRVSSLRSGNVSSLTEENVARWKELNPELTAEGRIGLLSEEEIEEDGGDWEVVDDEVLADADVVSTGAEIGEEAAAEAAETGIMEGAAALGEAVAAILGPAVIILVVVTEIIGAVEAGEMNEKLKKAETDMDQHLADQQKSLDSLRKSFKNLLDCAASDIDEYNELIADVLKLSPSKSRFFTGFRGYTPGTGFDYRGITGYKNSLDSVKDATTILTLQGLADSDISDVQACILAHAVQDSKDTEIISLIKEWLTNHGATDLPEEHIKSFADDLSVDEERIVYCNSLRMYLNEIAAKLLPYHKAINDIPQKAGTKTKQPEDDPIDHDPHHVDPHFSADPNDFALPAP